MTNRRTIKPLRKKNWSGGGDNLFANVEIAMERHADKFSDSGIPVVFKNVVPLKEILLGNYIYVPQNAWPWHGTAWGFREFTRRGILRLLSELARLRATKILRIGPMIPNSKNCMEEYLPNTLDQGFERAFSAAQESRKPDWAPSSQYFVVPGSYWSYRNLDTVIDGYIEYHSNSPEPIELLIVGPATHKRFYDHIKSKCAVCSKITIVGRKVPRNELLAAILYSRMCIFPSLVEASPVTVLEAAALEVPSIALDTPAYRFIEKELAGAKLHYFNKHEDLVQLMHNPVAKSQSTLRSKKYRENARVVWADTLVEMCLS